MFKNTLSECNCNFTIGLLVMNIPLDNLTEIKDIFTKLFHIWKKSELNN